MSTGGFEQAEWSPCIYGWNVPVLVVIGSGGRDAAVGEHVVVGVGGGVGAVVRAPEPVGGRRPEEEEVSIKFIWQSKTEWKEKQHVARKITFSVLLAI